ncbi:MAG: hypothetical protein ACE5FI_17950 [Anaerolineales bacterium]
MHSKLRPGMPFPTSPLFDGANAGELCADQPKGTGQARHMYGVRATFRQPSWSQRLVWQMPPPSMLRDEQL